MCYGHLSLIKHVAFIRNLFAVFFFFLWEIGGASTWDIERCSAKKLQHTEEDYKL